MAREYPDEVWNRLREVFETSPKLTWQSLVDQVGAELDCEMPSPSVVRRKAIKEKWKKKSKSLVKKTAHDLNQEIKKLTSDSTGQSDDQDNDNKDNSSGQKDVKNSSNLTLVIEQNIPKDKKTRLRTDELTAAKIIRKNRNLSARIARDLENILDSEAVLDAEIATINPNNLTENEEKSIKFKIAILTNRTERLMKQSVIAANTFRNDEVWWGLEKEELKDQSEQQARRTSTIIDAEQKLAKAKEEMKKQKRLAFERKLEMIEAGEDVHDEDVVEHE